MKKLYTLLVMIGLIVFGSTSNAQCANSNTLYLTIDAATITTGTTLSSCAYGGDYLLINNMQSGSSYTFETCGDTGFDTQLTIFNDATGAVIGYNDDFCGVQSSVTIVSDGSSVRVSLNQYNCQSNTTCMTILGSVAGPASDPCNNIAALSGCGDIGNFALNGSGLFDGNGPFSTPGAEQIFSFTATTTGAHIVDITNSGGYVDLFFIDAALGCSGTGWTYIDDVLTTASNSVNLVTGVTYYFMLDDENTTASTGTITVSCPSMVDPCNGIIALSGCDATDDFALPTGIGAFNNNGPWNTPGQEVIFSYTAPYSGDFEVEITHVGGSYIDLFYADAALGCSGSGWTYVDDIFGSATNTINLVGGTTYYFMIDDENTDATDGTIFIECPCIISTLPDDSFVYTGPFVVSGTTDDACNDCDLRPSEDMIYEIEIPCAGTYTFETCGSSFDTYLYLTDSFCGTVIASNDDSPCGGGFSVQSSITTTLAAGTYYVNVEAFSSAVTGAFDLSVSGTADIIDIEIDTFSNVSCFGGSDGSATAVVSSGTMPFNYVWSDGQSTATASGLPIGTYTVTGTDANGCVSDSATVTLTEPTLMTAYASCPTIECYGGTADMAVFAFGGTLPYIGTGVFNVSAGTYTYTVTDANGCTADVTHTVTQPAQLMFTITSLGIACNGGTTDVTVGPSLGSGGTPPYTGTFGTFNVGAGTYTYTMTDSLGCTEDTTIIITEPAVLLASASADSILCNGGTADITVTATGGTAPYMGTGVFSETAGTYFYTVTDANGCTTITNSVTLTEPTLMTAYASCPEILCNGGTVDMAVTAFGGTPLYTGTGVFSVSAGTYTYTVTDANGCTSSATHTVTEPSPLLVSITSTVITCPGGTSDVTVSASGGTAPYTGTGTFSAMAGTSTYTVTDANGCTTSVTITVTEPAALVATATVSPYDFFLGTADITVSATGGTSPYTGTGTFTESDGVYTYTVTDANGCTATVSATVSGGISGMVVYPNPIGASDEILVVKITTEQEDTDVPIRIYHLSGKVVYTNIMHLEEGSNVRNIDVTGFTSGSYFVEVVTDGLKKTTQFIVQ